MSYYGLLNRRRASAAAGLVTLESLDYSHIAIDPEDAAVGFTVSNSGLVNNVREFSGLASYPWLLSGAAIDYELRVDMVSGSASPSGSLGVWQSLSTSRGYSMARTVVGYRECVLDLSIRRASDGFLLTTARKTFFVEVESGA